jgi:hypothetical protein
MSPEPVLGIVRGDMPFWTQVVLGVCALTAIALALVRRAWSDRAVSAILAVLWVWAGAVHALGSMRRDAGVLAVALLFLAESLALASAGVGEGRLHFRFRARPQSALGIFVMFSALTIYPNAVHMLGTRPWTTPTIAMPGPTAVFTLGFFLCAERVPWPLWLAPGLACAANFVAAFRSGAAADLFLSSAGILGALAGLVPRLRRRRPRPTLGASATRLM